MKDLMLRARVVVRSSNMKFHDVVWQTTSKRAARAARLFFLVQPIKSLILIVALSLPLLSSFLKLPDVIESRER